MTKYALITPARNEESLIERTIESVIAQTSLPQRWVIVNDRSSDQTGKIAERYAERYDFIDVINVSGDDHRNFGSKAKAINFAYGELVDFDFDYIGNLDADITFDPSYYENILKEFESNSSLGLAGGVRYDLIDGVFVRVRVAMNSVGGPIQLFRRECWEAIGGYMELPKGGIDAAAEINARMKGWEVRSFPEYPVHHHRATGTADRTVWSAKFRAGLRDHSLGYHPMFETARAISRLPEKPFVIGALLTWLGFMYAWVTRLERVIPPEMVHYLHQEQMRRLKGGGKSTL